MAASDPVEIVHELRMQMGQKGGATLSSLALAFRVNDRDNTGLFNFADFEEILGKVGLFAPRQCLTRLYRYFDKNLTEQIDYREFLRALQGEVGPRRMAMIALVWDKLSCGRESIPVRLVVGAFSAMNHPRVLAGEKSEQQVFREFATSFESAGNVDGMVSWQQFADFYSAISASVPYNDGYFIKELENAWGVQENKASVTVPTALVRKVENVLREKVRQRSKQDGNEVEHLRLTLKHFDLDQSGLLDYKQFLKALERYGIILAPSVSEGLYADFELAGGVINYAEFVAALYNGEGLTPSYTLGATQPSLRPASTMTCLWVLGGPASGTTRACAQLKEEFGLVYLDPIALVDAEQNNPSSSLGKQIAAYASLGKAVPSSLVMEVLAETMTQYAAVGKSAFCLEGFPGTVEDLDAWETQAPALKVDVPVALLLHLPSHVAVQRMLVKDPQRKSVDRLLAHFEKETLAVTGQLGRRNMLATVQADAREEDLEAQIRQIAQSVL